MDVISFLDKVSTRVLNLLRSERGVNKQRAMQLENDLLRAQISPHLLNNGLTVLYEHVIKYSDRCAEMVELLAQLSAQAIHKSDDRGYISLFAELQTIKNYIKFFSLQTENDLFIEIAIDDINQDAIYIPPHIFLEPVVNLLKYGDHSNQGLPSRIEVRYEQSVLIFQTFNKIIPLEYRVSNQIGLGNLRRRLENNYRSKYELLIKSSEREFKLILSLQL
nr:histidine kinase [Pedobacter ureilyticus]